jgi:hypothetical protein
MSAAASILSIYHTLPNDLAVANLNIEPRGVDFYFFHTLHYGLGSELFDSLEHCNRRLRGWALAEGFDIVRQGGGTKVAPAYKL